MAKMGRPTKHDPDMHQTVIDLMRDGHGVVAVCSELGIDKETFYNWCDPKHASFKPDFFDTVKKARVLYQKWWEDVGRNSMYDKEFNATAWIFQMKNRFRDDWGDISRHEISGKDGAPIEHRHKVDLTEFSDDQLEQLELILAPANSGGKNS